MALPSRSIEKRRLFSDPPALAKKSDSRENVYCGKLNILEVDENIKNDGKKSVNFVILDLKEPVENKKTASMGWAVSRNTIESVAILLNSNLLKKGDLLDACLTDCIESAPSRGGESPIVTKFVSFEFQLPVRVDVQFQLKMYCAEASVW